MSGKRIVETCEHGETERHLVHRSHTLRCYCTQKCDGGRTLTEGQYVLIEKVDGGWITDTAVWYDTVPHLLNDLFDALSDHTEGET